MQHFNRHKINVITTMITLHRTFTSDKFENWNCSSSWRFFMPFPSCIQSYENYEVLTWKEPAFWIIVVRARDIAILKCSIKHCISGCALPTFVFAYTSLRPLISISFSSCVKVIMNSVDVFLLMTNSNLHTKILNWV